MQLIIFIVSLILFIIGVLIKYLKFHVLIAGYNTLSDEKKQGIDQAGLGNFIGNLLFLMALILAAGGILAVLGYYKASWLSFLLIFPAAIYGVVHSAQFTPKGKPTKYAILTVAGAAVVFSLIIGIVIWGGQEAVFEVNTKNIKISGMYGMEIPLSEIQKITMDNKLPVIVKRMNGLDNGEVLKGDFDLEGLGKARLFVYPNKQKYITIFYRSGYIIFNYPENQKTEDLYQNLKLFWHP